ncbi:hypothetical protein Kisp01_20460 [Kineosporia sp. NBRC 101677]|uniref:hypothetical protein n=1 Tax=Kineosporia sp. NBRC 101677 TaxID=3032197 RepID=UPI0024A10968|nr:hypothetical protein [Kineosporia sp. NBRC 101677]GLY15031.1 hypothetical protein Kisp01_20460 [Kineosporia sp. NBRC 101677]
MPNLKRTIALAAALSLIVLTSLGALSASAHQQHSPNEVIPMAGKKATQIVRISPFTSSGALKKAWKADVEPRDEDADPDDGIDCSESMSPSFALNDGTYECPPTVLGAYACWSSPKYAGQLLCLNAPGSKTLRSMAVRNLPATTRAPRTPRPLALELADGSRWNLKTGGTYPAHKDGLQGIYLCANKVCSKKRTGKDLAVLSSGGHGVNRSKPVWTVRVGEVGSYDESFPAPKRQKVKKAYFIHNGVG